MTVANYQRRRLIRDKLARFIITMFGGIVLLTLLSLIYHLFSQAAPLFSSPSMQFEQRLQIPSGHQLLAISDITRDGFIATQDKDCHISLWSQQGSQLVEMQHLTRLCEHQQFISTHKGKLYLSDVSTKGLLRLTLLPSFPTHSIYDRDINPLHEPQLLLSNALPYDIWQHTQHWQMILGERWALIWAQTEEQHFLRWISRENPNHFIDHRFAKALKLLPLVDAEQMLYFDHQQLQSQYLTGANVNLAEWPNGVMWWQALPNQRTWFLQDGQGRVTKWQLVNVEGNMRYQPSPVPSLDQQTPYTQLAIHPNRNAMVLADEAQNIKLINRISGERFGEWQHPQASEHIFWFGSLLVFTDATGFSQWRLDHLDGVTSLSVLFEKQGYEGYTSPAYVWQTTSGSDYMEAKYSLVPLLMGSVKASVLALIIAVPLALGAAIYTAYFAPLRHRGWIKPAVELLEAIPSVIIGFIAAIWIAPVAEQFLFSFFFFLFVLPPLLAFIALFQHRLARRFPPRWREGVELLTIPAGLLLLLWVSIEPAPQLILNAYNVDSLRTLMQFTNDPISKSTIVVAIALGLAIAPSVYSLMEDAISGVPDSVRFASYALGATRLQTLQRVVLQMAMPGLLAAVMLGFGRAFGETMIVLMVTGNTPVANWDLLQGLRALTANLAIELPEADKEGVHYRVLFLTACLLFIFTFVVNTLAEVLSQRIRRTTGDFE